MLESLMFKQVLIDGSVLSLVMGVIIVLSLRYNPRLWIGDYPKAIRDKVLPLTPVEKRDRMIVTALVFIAIVSIMLVSAIELKVERGDSITFGIAYLNLFLVLMVFNIFDAVVIDLLWLTLLKPKFVILTGMEGMEHVLYDYRKQVGDFFKGFIFCAVFSLPFAVIALL
jgi:hypothetical protein